MVPISVAEGPHLVPISLKIRSPFGPHFEKFRSLFHVGAVRNFLIVSFSYLREADDDFLDELLGGVGGQIASLIPKDVDSQVFTFEALNLNQ